MSAPARSGHPPRHRKTVHEYVNQAKYWSRVLSYRLEQLDFSPWSWALTEEDVYDFELAHSKEKEGWVRAVSWLIVWMHHKD